MEDLTPLLDIGSLGVLAWLIVQMMKQRDEDRKAIRALSQSLDANTAVLRGLEGMVGWLGQQTHPPPQPPQPPM